MAVLFANARRRTVRVWAENSPFELKAELKRRGYSWSDDTNGSPRAWHIDVGEDQHQAELEYLRQDI